VHIKFAIWPIASRSLVILSARVSRAGWTFRGQDRADATYSSPDNVKRCEKLSREFRNENNSKIAWKDDVLQLSNMNWYAQADFKYRRYATHSPFIACRHAWCSSRALAGYKEETTSNPTLDAEIETLFNSLPREARRTCAQVNHNSKFVKEAPYKDGFAKAVSSKASGVKQQTSGRRAVKRPNLSSHVINVEGETSSSPGPASPLPRPSAASSSRNGRPTNMSAPEQQPRWKALLDRMADEMIEAGSVSDITDWSTMRGMLAVAVKRSGLLLPPDRV
jgi:hypothetical protein